MHGGSGSPVADEQIPGFRRAFLIGWIVVVGGIPWLLRSQPVGPPSISIWWPIGLAILSIPLGWELGYKRLIGPLFCGIVVVPKLRPVSNNEVNSP